METALLFVSVNPDGEGSAILSSCWLFERRVVGPPRSCASLWVAVFVDTKTFLLFCCVRATVARIGDLDVARALHIAVICAWGASRRNVQNPSRALVNLGAGLCERDELAHRLAELLAVLALLDELSRTLLILRFGIG